MRRSGRCRAPAPFLAGPAAACGRRRTPGSTNSDSDLGQSGGRIRGCIGPQPDVRPHGRERRLRAAQGVLEVHHLAGVENARQQGRGPDGQDDRVDAVDSGREACCPHPARSRRAGLCSTPGWADRVGGRSARGAPMSVRASRACGEAVRAEGRVDARDVVRRDDGRWQPPLPPLDRREVHRSARIPNVADGQLAGCPPEGHRPRPARRGSRRSRRRRIRTRIPAAAP